MRIRFYNARILTMEKDLSILEGNELWADDGKITYIGPPRSSNSVFHREIDASGGLLMPGFKNAHTHSAMTFLRSYADDLPLGDWLNRLVLPREAKLTPDDAYHLSKLANLEYLTSGITANYDMYLFPEASARASADMGFRTVLCNTLNDYYSSLEQVEREYRELNNFHPLISYQFAFHGEYTTSSHLLEGMAELSHRYHAPVSLHCCETKSEVEGCIQRHGATPPVYLNSIGMFDYGGTCFHCVHVTDADMDVFQQKQVHVVTNPASNAKLASGIAPLTDFVQRGIGVAIGTDGPASNNCLDFFREMFLTTALQKLRLEDASALDAEVVLTMAVKGGANAMGLKDCDCLALGKVADLILIDLDQPNMQPLNHLVKNLVYSGSKQNVRLTMVDGRILYEDGKFFVGEDPRDIYAKANEIAQRIFAEV